MPPLTPPHQWRGRSGEPAPNRRELLRLMAATAALGGLAGCDPSAPDEYLIPAVHPADYIVPGLPNHFATALTDGGAAAGIVVRHDMGRPVKIEGNPLHPGSLGSTSIHGQAMLLDFYDPDRSSGLLQHGQIAPWQTLQAQLLPLRARLAATHGAGLRILTGQVVSPSTGGAIDAALRQYDAARWYQWEPVSREAASAGVQRAYGARYDVLPRVAAADVLVALDSDLISSAPGHLRHARDFASRRNPTRGRMSRVYAAEPVPTLIGAAADHRFIAGPREMHAIIKALAAAILDGSAGTDWVGAVADDLRAAGARSLIHLGPDQPAEMHDIVHQMNERLGARGTTFDLIPPAAWQPAMGNIGELLDDMHAGRVETLLVLGANPVYTMPDFADALRHVGFSLASSDRADETAIAATWYVPAAHLFETWGDARAHDGTVAIQQPQALPLYGGRSAFEILALFIDGAERRAFDQVRDTWRDHLDDAGWRDALANGVVPGTTFAPVDARPISGPITVTLPPERAVTLLIRPDPNVLDGRYANNPWLQELPRPLGKIVWDNPLLLAPALLRAHGFSNGDIIEVRAANQIVRLPVWSVPGVAADCAVAFLGFGRTAAGAVGNGVGVDVASLRGVDDGVELRRTGERALIASTDHHNMMDVAPGLVDDIVRHVTLATFTGFPARPEPEIYQPPRAPGVAWGMSIDLNACIGCNACVLACQAENNVPVVGKAEVLRGREMHWLRIDRYFEGTEDDPLSLSQPMLCMQCEQAPCEPVCPVEASIHDSEGLNLQVYNRCIGTRFCSNNCPYKVRRFNFGAWAAEEPRAPISRNPDVTVRGRGVMEKCTFCVQRIAAARIAHDITGAPETVVTACQAACPTQAFTFGNINDPAAGVTQRKQSKLSYVLLEDQNTHPRVTYEARVFNRNPKLGAS